MSLFFGEASGAHRFDVPDDGLPCIDDFITTFESMLLGGIELGREPIDCTMPQLGGLNITLFE